jgi:hypothetical protein
MKGRKVKSVGHIVHRNCLVKHVTEGRIEGRLQAIKGRGRRRNQLLNDLKETRSY